MKPYLTIIIDDEAPARAGLQNLLKAFPDTFLVLDTAKNATEAKEKIEHLDPDLIFLDIEMPGLNGFELLQSLNKLPIVIFCTAYDQYAVEAFETNSIDYLVKPVKQERIEKTIQKLKMLERNVISSEEIRAVLDHISSQKKQQQMTSITVKKNDKLIFLKLEEIAYFEADNNYVNIHSEQGIYVSSESITNLEAKLPENFLRVHRGMIINTHFVKEVQKYFNSRFIITLNNIKNSCITTGRSYSKIVKGWMNL